MFQNSGRRPSRIRSAPLTSKARECCFTSFTRVQHTKLQITMVIRPLLRFAGLLPLQVAAEGLAGGHGPLGPTPFHLNYRLRVVIETETGLATKSRAPTTVDVVGQVLDRGPAPDHLADGRQRRHPGFGLRQLRRARFPLVGLTMTHEGLLLRFGLIHKTPP